MSRPRGPDNDESMERLLRAIGTTDAPPPGAELEHQLAGLRPVRTRRPLRQLLAATGLSLLHGGLLLWLVRMRRDLLDLPLSWVVALAALWLLGFAGIMTAVLVPPRGQVMPAWRRCAWSAAAAVALFLLIGALPAPVAPGRSVVPEPGLTGLWRHGRSCLLFGLVCAVVPALLAGRAVRGAAVIGAQWVAAAIGAASGALGGLVLHLYCPVTEGWHLSLSHGGVVLTASVLAVFLHRLLRRD